MKLGLIGVPQYHGCDNNGVQYGPQKLRTNNLEKTLKSKGIKVKYIKDIEIEIIDNKDKFKGDKNIKFYESIYNTNIKLADTVYNSLNEEYFPIILGGDHSLGLGSISGASKYFDNIGVVWIDAHGDFNTEVISESKNAHGMPLAFLTGYGKKELVNLYFEGVKVKEENVFHIGGRDIDEKERELLNQTKVNLYDKEVIDKKGFTCIIEEILKKCEEQNINALHISFDIDFMDKYLVPGTGTRVEGGYTVEDSKYILKELIESKLVKSMDFVEFNPLLDEDNKTLDICNELLEYFVEVLIKEI
ncbi:arginase [Romboutsia timonensis]|uniref:arginase n=1 Tax=Romboutsia timonensis TaxID=1776391 RepID=UPI00399509A5